jgi:hypothetical protein
LFFTCLLLYSCENSCISYARDYIKEEYAFTIDTMYLPTSSTTTWRYEGNGQTFTAWQRGYFRDLVTTGDSIVKKKGELEVTVYKKDTMFIYSFHCGNRTVTAKNLH